MELQIEELNETGLTYYQKHRDAILIKKKLYYQANRDKLLAKCNKYAKQLIMCNHCGNEFTRCRLGSHLKKIQQEISSETETESESITDD